jgi:hypothetical protein
MNGDVEFEHVIFSYPTRAEQVKSLMAEIKISKTSEHFYLSFFLCPPSKKRGFNALLLSVGRYVGLSVDQLFHFIFFALVAHTEVKFGIQIYHKNIKVKLCFGYDQAIFYRFMPLGL